jgi:hypothetical protein
VGLLHLRNDITKFSTLQRWYGRKVANLHLYWGPESLPEFSPDIGFQLSTEEPICNQLQLEITYRFLDNTKLIDTIYFSENVYEGKAMHQPAIGSHNEI